MNFLSAKPKETLGIFISTGTIISVQARQGKDKPQIVKYSVDKIPVNLVPFNIHSQDFQEFSSYLKDLIKQKGYNASFVVSAISGESSVSRYFKLPRVLKKEEFNAVRYEARKYIPFKLDEIFCDYQILNESAPSKELEVLFAAVEKSVSEKFLTIFDKADVDLQALEIIPFALLRTFLLNGQLNPEATNAVIYAYDSENVSINILSKNFLYLSRDAHILAKDAAGFLEGLSGEIRTSIQFCKSEFKCESVGKIIVCGEADFISWVSFLKDEFAVPVEIGNPFKWLGVSDINSPKWAVALGLALRDIIEQDIFKINLLPKESSKKLKIYLPKLKFVIPAKVFVIEAALAILILVTFGIIMARVESGLKAQLENLDKRLSLVESPKGSLDGKNVLKLKDTVNAKLAFLKAIIDNRIFWTKKLNVIPSHMPADCWLTEIQFEEEMVPGENKFYRKIILKGETSPGKNEFELVSLFAENLKRDANFFEGFNELKLSSIYKEKRRDFEFGKFEISYFSKEK